MSIHFIIFMECSEIGNLDICSSTEEMTFYCRFVQSDLEDWDNGECEEEVEGDDYC